MSPSQQQSVYATPATAATAAIRRASVLMRACDCGRSAPGPSGQCASCAVEDRLGPGAHVTLGPADDAYERQADRIADRVVSAGPASVPAGEGITRLQRQTLEEEELLQPMPDRLQRQDEEEEESLQMKPDRRQCHERAAGEPLQTNPERIQRQEEEEELLQLKAAGPVGSGTSAGTATAAAASAVASGGRPLSGSERAWFEPRFGAGLSHVRLHTDAAAGRAARDIGARAYTLGRHIAFAPGEYAPSSSDGRRLMAHELVHTLQQSALRLPAGLGTAPGPVRRQPTSLGAIAEGERRQIQVSTRPVAVPAERVTAFFSLMDNGRHGETQSIGGASTVFGAGIDAALQTGLGSIGAWLATTTNALPMNMTIEVELDLSAHGGAQRRYRFTRFTHRTGRGESAASTPVLLVEDAGPALTAPAQASVPSSMTIGSGTYPLSGSWSSGDYAQLHQAVSLLPAAAQTAANGLTFRRRRGDAGGAEAGHYDSATDTVDLFDNAFPSSSVRFGGRTAAVRNIVHEIGHALDLRPLEAAWGTFNAAGQSAAARRAFLAVRSPSGMRWVRDQASGDYRQEMNPSDRSPAFRRAVRTDGVRPESQQRTTPEGTTATLSGGVTTYSDTDYQELFAESFMLYTSAPETLRALRPATFAFFQRAYPRSPP